MIHVRVLVVDDSATYRRILTDLLGAEPGIEVVGSAPSGKLALAKIPQVNPDVVTLDVEMAEMNGLETLAAIRALYPKLPVVMCSSITTAGAEATIDALLRGANDYVAKPTTPEGAVTLARELIPKVLRLGGAHLQALRAGMHDATPAHPSPVAAPKPSPVDEKPSRPVGLRVRGPIEMVAIGVSTGGPNALASVFNTLPRLGVPIVVVQHMPPIFTATLASRLDALSTFQVREGVPGAKLEPDTAWVAPGDYHMAVVRDGFGYALQTHQGPPENSCRPAVDVLFRSVASTVGGSVLAVVMTGMGQDGMYGCEHVREAGGEVWIQDEASSVVWGMPGAVHRAGLAQRTLPLERIGLEIGRVVNESRNQRLHLEAPR